MQVRRVLARIAFGAGVVAGLVVIAMLAATVWLTLTQPMRMAAALDSGDMRSLAVAVFDTMVSALRTVVNYL